MTNKTIEIKHSLNPLPADADGQFAHKLSLDLSGWRPFEPGLAGVWNSNFQMKPDPATFFSEILGLKSKEDYLAFRDLLKAHLRFFAADQKRLAMAMRAPGGDPNAQSRHAQHAWLISRLIEIRRAGKVWAAAEAAGARTKAA